MFAFPPETVDFLRELREHNDRAWFDANRDRYQAAYVEPAKRFVEEGGAALPELAPAIRAEPRINGSIRRINRDTRFSQDKRPYKDHLDVWFWEGERKAALSAFMLRITPDYLGIGAGAHGFAKDALARFRRAVRDADAGAELAQIAAVLERGGDTLAGSTYKRVPAGLAPDPAAARFLLHSALFAFHEDRVETATDRECFLPACLSVWTRVAPLHRWLVDHVQGG